MRVVKSKDERGEFYVVYNGRAIGTRYRFTEKSKAAAREKAGKQLYILTKKCLTTVEKLGGISKSKNGYVVKFYKNGVLVQQKFSSKEKAVTLYKKMFSKN